MNVLQPISTPQTLIFIPRFDADSVNIVLTNEETEKDFTYQLATSYLDGLMETEIAHNFKEGGNYTFEVSDLSDELMYRGKIFTTAQTDLQNYKSNTDFLYA